MFQTSRLTLTDFAVFTLYIGILLIVGLFDRRRQNKAREHFLGGQSASWGRVGFALYASTISATSLVGLTGTSYAHGISSAFSYEWPAAIVLVVFCGVVLPTYIRSRIFTVPEFLELRYGRFVRTYVSGLGIGLGIFLDASGCLFAGAVLFQALFPGWPLWGVCALLSTLAGAFLIAGGLRAIIAVESVQGMVMVVSCAALAFFTFSAIGHLHGGPDQGILGGLMAGWHNVMTGIDPSHLKLILPASDPYMPWTGLVTGVPLIGFYFWCTNQTMVQRVLAAKSLDDGRLGSLLGGALKLTSLFLVCLPAAGAMLLFPHLDRPDQVFSKLLFDVLPHGLTGLFLAACLISVLASLSGVYNSTSTLMTMDFIRKARPDMSEAGLVRTGKLMTLVIMIISILWAPQIVHFKDTLWQYLQAVLCYFVPPIAAVFIAGLFIPRANARGAGFSLMVGTTASFVLFFAIEVFHVLPLHFLVAAMVIFLIALAALLAASLTAPAPDRAQIGPLMFSKAVWQAETEHLKTVSWYKNYRYLSLGLLAVTALIVVWFA
ncbi:sodium/solute symporter [Asticcacaulis sp. EMRT-3]|uniref:sodium:solute symporter family transporter n=1 Tax=Asticcacaulis sp. EMRT-3 TaxID=3040349 RepID=UPI0024AFD0E5|nr:sodium/solute symporter [Asticcacaulis sp. EMRT-3]MDI7776342.1 sodium/solute symporter [Asticcacaulis sp. EMRT-3]